MLEVLRDAGGCWEVLGDAEDAGGCWEVLGDAADAGSAGRCREVLGDIRTCPGVPRGAAGCQGVPGGAGGCQGVTGGSGGCQGVPRGAGGSQEVLGSQPCSFAPSSQPSGASALGQSGTLPLAGYHPPHLRLGAHRSSGAHRALPAQRSLQIRASSPYYSSQAAKSRRSLNLLAWTSTG